MYSAVNVILVKGLAEHIINLNSISMSRPHISELVLCII